LKRQRRVSRSQFFATVRDLLSNYDDVHAKLRPDGEWSTKVLRPDGEWASKVPKGPQHADEWSRVELYMGLFEYCERLLKDGLLNRRDFDANLRYRVVNIVANPFIVNKILKPPRVQYWSDFMQLCKRCKVKIPEHLTLAS
jgi:hypothetical protein